MRALLLALLVLALTPGAAAAATVVELDAGSGTRVRVEDAPLRIALLGADGAEQLATFAGVTVRIALRSGGRRVRLPSRVYRTCVGRPISSPR